MVPPEIMPRALVGWDKAEFSSQVNQSPVLASTRAGQFISCLFRLQEVALSDRREIPNFKGSWEYMLCSLKMAPGFK